MEIELKVYKYKDTIIYELLCWMNDVFQLKGIRVEKKTMIRENEGISLKTSNKYLESSINWGSWRRF